VKIETVQIQTSVHSFHWTKWGGKRPDLLETEKEKERTNWYCQGCGLEQMAELPPYRLKYDDTLGYLNVCPKCLIDNTFMARIKKLPDPA
jgi:hypothetical protein